MDKLPLLDEIVLIDSNSIDRTRDIARELGLPVYIHQELLPQLGARRGKGEALWKSLLVTRGDIVVWIDTDIVNIHPRFVYGVLGPMLIDPKIQFVKGFLSAPAARGRQDSGGRRRARHRIDRAAHVEFVLSRTLRRGAAAVRRIRRTAHRHWSSCRSSPVTAWRPAC